MYQSKKRLEWLDALRGACVVLMILYHFLYDLTVFDLLPPRIMDNPLIEVVHFSFAAVFILISGYCCSLSRSNVKRGVKLLFVSLALSGVTYLAEILALKYLYVELECFIVFGVLHMLSLCMLLYGIFFSKLKTGVWMPILLCLAAIGTAGFVRGRATGLNWLFPFGLISEDFRSADYFPLMPWGFVFMLGTWLGKHGKKLEIKTKKNSRKRRLLVWLGRHSLGVYLLHQPLLLGAIIAIAAILVIL